VNSVCPKCGGTLAPETKFCGHCGTVATKPDTEVYLQLEKLAELKGKGVLTEEEFQNQKAKLLSGSQQVAAEHQFRNSAPAPSAALAERVAVKKPLSAWIGVLISVGLFCIMIAFVMRFADVESAKGTIGLIALGTAVWASIDAYRLGLKNYRTGFARGAIGVFFVWLIFFPLSCGFYLVARSRIKAGITPRVGTGGSRSSWSAIRVVAWVAGGLVLVALVSAALFLGEGGNVKGVWATTNSQLAAANMAVGTPTSQAATDAPKPSESAVEGDSAVISVVTNGILANYNTTTVGKAFEGTFQDPKWTTFVSPKGVTVVQFDGTITALKLTEQGFVEFDGIYKRPASELVDGCIEKLGLSAQRAQFNMDWLATTPSSTLLSTKPLDVQHYNIQKCVAAQVAIPVQFQFVLSADHTSFQIGYLDETPFKVNGRCNVEKVFSFIYQ